MEHVRVHQPACCAAGASSGPHLTTALPPRLNVQPVGVACLLPPPSFYTHTHTNLTAHCACLQGARARWCHSTSAFVRWTGGAGRRLATSVLVPVSLCLCLSLSLRRTCIRCANSLHHPHAHNPHGRCIRSRKGYISAEELMSIPELSINPLAQRLVRAHPYACCGQEGGVQRRPALMAVADLYLRQL